jgi:arylsulfatase A
MQRFRRKVLLAVICALGAIFCPPRGPTLLSAADSLPRPTNIVLILADDLGWADLGCYGSTFHETPHLDRLAGQGMRFTDAYAACPVCSPTRASILTGKYPARLGLTDWIPGRGDRPDQKLLAPDFLQHLPLEELTLAEFLATAGYASASIGKWHLGGDGHLPTDQGFSLNVAGSERGSPPSYFWPYARASQPQHNLTHLAESGREGEYLTDRLAEEAARFIAAHRDRPFFLYLPHFAVHTPIQARPDLVARYEAEVRPDRPQHNPHYAAMLESLDQAVGRVVAALDEAGIAEQTIVIFTSDNGGLSVEEGQRTPATSNAPLREGKGYFYEGGIRVPLIVRWPGVVAPESLCPTAVSSIDLFPTVLDAAGVEVNSGQPIDGLSLVPLLTQTGKLDREALYWHYPHYSNQGGAPAGAVRRGDMKLIEDYEDVHVELYNLRDDLSEMRDMAQAMPDEARALRDLLHGWRRGVGARMPTAKAP